MKEFSLEKGSIKIRFKSLEELFVYLREIGEVDGWVLRIHHM